MAASEHEGEGRKFLGMYEGPVIDNKDPKKLGRVRVQIPGVAEPTGWALPFGAPGAGGKKLGGWTTVPIGAEVAVWFKQGQLDHPRYIAGFAGDGETPDEVEQSSVEDALKIPLLWQGNRWKIIADERKDTARIAIEDKLTGDLYEIDGVNLGLRLKSTSAMSLECDGAIDIKGSTVTINGRKVAPTNQPM